MCNFSTFKYSTFAFKETENLSADLVFFFFFFFLNSQIRRNKV